MIACRTRRLPVIGCMALLAISARSLCGTVVAVQPSTPPAATVNAPAAVVPAKLPLDNVAGGVLAVAWGSGSGPSETISPPPLASLTPGTLFSQVLGAMLAQGSGALAVAHWAPSPAAASPAPDAQAAELWQYRLSAHRAATNAALSAKPGVASRLATLAEGLALINSIRRQAPEAMDTGPEGRVLRVLNFINTRSVYLAAVTPPASGEPAGVGPLAQTSLVRLAISWSSRSESPERCRAVVIGEAAISATDWPADVTPGPWLLAVKPNAYYGALGSGLGNYLRYAVALQTAAKPGVGRGPESPATAISPAANELAGTISRNTDRTIFLTRLNDVVTLIFPCRGADEAAAALAATATLLGTTPGQPTATAFGGIKLVRLGQRSIGLELSPAK